MKKKKTGLKGFFHDYIRSFITKLVLFIVGIALIAIVPSVLSAYFTNRKMALENANVSARNVAKACADYLSDKNVLSFLSLDEKEQEAIREGKNEEYNGIDSYLAKIKTDFDLAYLYVFVPDFEQNTMLYIFNSGMDKYEHGSLIGFHHVSENVAWNTCELVAGKEGYVYEGVSLYHNQYGDFVVSSAPIKKMANETPQAILSAEYNVSDAIKNVGVRALYTGLFAFLAILVFAALLVLFIYLKFVRPMKSNFGAVTTGKEEKKPEEPRQKKQEEKPSLEKETSSTTGSVWKEIVKDETEKVVDQATIIISNKVKEKAGDIKDEVIKKAKDKKNKIRNSGENE